MKHTCPDGNQTRLTRNGPIGTMVGVSCECPRCGYKKSAVAIYEGARRILSDPKVIAAVAK